MQNQTMEKKESLENSLFKDLTGNSIELTSELGELTIDQFIDNDLLKEIPFFSIFYKSIKTAKGIREAMFVMKVYKFMKEFNSIKEKEKDLFLQKISSDSKERTKIGQTLILILEKIDNLDKTSILANLFAAYMEQKISKSEFMHLCSIVQASFIDHLETFFKTQKINDIPQEIQSSLSSFGLMSPLIIDTQTMYGEEVLLEKNDYHLVYTLTNIGKKMRQNGQRV